MKELKGIKERLIRVLLSIVAAGVVFAAGCYNDDIGDTIIDENVFAQYGNTTNPVPGNFGIVTTSDITNTSIRLEWTKATDDATPQYLLEYRVQYSTDSTFATYSWGNDWTADLSGIDVPGLSAGQTYYFKVLVRDEGGATAEYDVVSANTTIAGSGTIYMYATATTHTGNILQVNTAPSMRLGLNNICKAQTDFSTHKCSNALAFISVNAADDIKAMKENPGKYGIPIARKVQSTTGNAIADTWADLFTALSDTLEHLGAADSFWWSGSAADLSYDADASCGGWLSEGGKVDGAEGAHNNTAYPAWISHGTRNCTNSLHVLCVCW